MNTANVQIARIGFKQAVIVAIISGFFGLIGAFIQYSVKKPTTRPEMVGFFSEKLPVGSIISSIVDPKTFSILAGDDGGFDPISSTWVPADGREVPGSKYSKKIASMVPDLRGMFLRGLNYSEEIRVRNDGLEDPGGENRKAGDYQKDAIIAHLHLISEFTADTSTRGSRLPINKSTTQGNWIPELPPDALDKEGKPIAASETRPRNIAVYYYLRIN